MREKGTYYADSLLEGLFGLELVFATACKFFGFQFSSLCAEWTQGGQGSGQCEECSEGY